MIADQQFLFVYAKQGKVQCLTGDQAKNGHMDMLENGWNHTATIDPARWIESLCMGHGDPIDMIDELQFKP